MSINDLVQDVEDAARAAVLRSGALVPCPVHKDVLIRHGDSDAERRAYAMATNALKRDGSTFLREEVLPAIKNDLDMAADGECPECARLRDA